MKWEDVETMADLMEYGEDEPCSGLAEGKPIRSMEEFKRRFLPSMTPPETAEEAGERIARTFVDGVCRDVERAQTLSPDAQAALSAQNPIALEADEPEGDVVTVVDLPGNGPPTDCWELSEDEWEEVLGLRGGAP